MGTALTRTGGQECVYEVNITLRPVRVALPWTFNPSNKLKSYRPISVKIIDEQRYSPTCRELEFSSLADSESTTKAFWGRSSGDVRVRRGAGQIFLLIFHSMTFHRQSPLDILPFWHFRPVDLPPPIGYVRRHRYNNSTWTICVIDFEGLGYILEQVTIINDLGWLGRRGILIGKCSEKVNVQKWIGQGGSDQVKGKGKFGDTRWIKREVQGKNRECPSLINVAVVRGKW